MADYIWHQHYGAGVPKEINPDSYPSIVAAFEESCDKFGDKVAFENMGVPMTFNELKQRSHNFAAWIQNNTDLVPGDKIAIHVVNQDLVPKAVVPSAYHPSIRRPLYTCHILSINFKQFQQLPGINGKYTDVIFTFATLSQSKKLSI